MKNHKSEAAWAIVLIVIFFFMFAPFLGEVQKEERYQVVQYEINDSTREFVEYASWSFATYEDAKEFTRELTSDTGSLQGFSYVEIAPRQRR